MSRNYNQDEYAALEARFHYSDEVYTEGDTDTKRDINEGYMVGIISGSAENYSGMVVWPLLAVPRSTGFLGNELGSYFDSLGEEEKAKIQKDFPNKDYTFWAFDPQVVYNKNELATLEQMIRQLEYETLR